MQFLFSINPDIYAWVVLPLLIFLARIADQTIGTLRLIFLGKGMKVVAPILGFFEVIIWLSAAAQAMKHLDHWICYVAYGGGFAMGNYIGLVLEERLKLGIAIIRVILTKNSPELIEKLSAQGFGLTIMNAEGAKGSVKILFSILRRKELPNFIKTVNEYNPNAFYTIEEVKSVNEGVFRGNTEKQTARFFSRITKAK